METQEQGSAPPVEPAGTPEVKAEEKKPAATEGTKFETKPKTQPMPDIAPPKGARFVLNEKTGLWDVVGEMTPDLHEKLSTLKPGEQPPTVPAETTQLVIPEMYESLATDEHRAQIEEGGELLAAAGFKPVEQQRVIDLLTESAVYFKNAAITIGDQDSVLGVLRTEWGTEYDTRLAAAQAQAKKLGPAFCKFLDETGLGDSPAVLDTLANLGTGLMSVSKADAEKQIVELKAAIRAKPYSRDHKLMLSKLRVLTERVARGDDPQALEKAVRASFKQGVGAASRGEEIARPAAQPAADHEARIKQIRNDPEYRKGSGPRFKELHAEMTAEYARLYPGKEDSQ